MNIYVLRHGLTDYNLQGKFQGQVDIAINAKGVEQAQKAAQELKNIKFDFIFSSPLKRALQTAKIVTNSEIIVDNRLTERSFGKLEGKYSIENYESRVEEFQIETLENLQHRVYDFLNELTSKYKNCSNILIVTHACIALMVEQYFSNNRGESETLKNGEYKKYTI